MLPFDRPPLGERAALVHLGLPGGPGTDSLHELEELVASAGLVPALAVRARRRAADPALFLGRGRVEALAEAVRSAGIGLVVFNHALSPTQQRNLESALEVRVMDRTELILHIFAARASTAEGKLQVELAQLRHLSTRLVRGWTHLERQKGGIGLRGGPGETQLEADRRVIGRRIRQLSERLERVRRRREASRRARRRRSLGAVTLVGYTNAGKSTLFNQLTGACVDAEDRLFATLDPTARRVELPGPVSVVVSDTVGFIRELPHDLVAAFRATLEVAREAELLLVVVDVSDPASGEHRRHVHAVLDEIGAADVPRLEVCNKIDRLDGEQPRVERDGEGRPARVWLSAATGEGLAGLRAAISERLGPSRQRGWVRLQPAQGRLHARLHAEGLVLRERPLDSGGWLAEVRTDAPAFARLARSGGLEPLAVQPAELLRGEGDGAGGAEHAA